VQNSFAKEFFSHSIHIEIFAKNSIHKGFPNLYLMQNETLSKTFGQFSGFCQPPNKTRNKPAKEFTIKRNGR